MILDFSVWTFCRDTMHKTSYKVKPPIRNVIVILKVFKVE